MIIVLAYWVIIFFLVLPFGLLLQKSLRIKTHDVVLTCLSGFIPLTLAFTITSFFAGLNQFSFYTVLLISILLYLIYFKSLSKLISVAFSDYRPKKNAGLILLILIVIGTALKSAQYPSIVDNESYYIQTIKWVNEYGLVKGLANLHLFFAQASPWHILHAGLNFSFLGFWFNDLNGFFLILTLIYSQKLSDWESAWMNLLPLASVICFLFIDSPSPDLALLCLIPIIISLYASETNNDNFKIITLLFVFAAFVKITILPFGVFLLPKLRRDKNITFLLITGLVFGIVWIVKNLIVSGYPLYPLTVFRIDADWTVPIDVIDTINAIGHRDTYCTTSHNLVQMFASWIDLPGVKGIMNKLILVLLLIIPLFREIRINNRYRAIYFSFLTQLIILWFVSPQYRFFLPAIIFFLLFLTHKLIIKFNLYRFTSYLTNSGVAIAIVLTVILVPHGISSKKAYNATEEPGRLNIYKPAPPTRYPDIEFEAIKIGNLEYYSVKDNFLLFATCNGELPCVNQAQIDYIRERTGYIPQIRRGKYLKGYSIVSGFHSVKAGD